MYADMYKRANVHPGVISNIIMIQLAQSFKPALIVDVIIHVSNLGLSDILYIQSQMCKRNPEVAL